MIAEVAEDLDQLNLLNVTELAFIIRRQTGLVVKRSVSKERLIELLENGGMPTPEEISPTTETRKSLQLYIEKNWTGIQSQLPCKGENRGRCTVYPCPEGRHVDCFLSATPHMKIHGL
jgi:hypothetical protein